MRKTCAFVLAIFSVVAAPLLASDFYVSPAGTSAGTGSKTHPWDLATALAQPSSVKPGDTIWMRGGTYTGHFVSSLKGAPNMPIIFRQYPGERATIDGNADGIEPILIINGSYSWFWGLEIFNSESTRSTPIGVKVPRHGEGVNVFGDSNKLINLIVHDTLEGPLAPSGTSFNTEISGCLIYYNGDDRPDRGHGHGIYVQNAPTSTRRITDNIIFRQFGIGIHAYTEGGTLDNLYLEGNVSFNNGELSRVSGFTTNILVGASGTPASEPTASAKVAKNTSLFSNYTYFPADEGEAVNLGYSKGIASPKIIDNYFVGRRSLVLVNAFRPITMTGNTLYGAISGFQTSEFPSNIYFSARPTGVKVFVRPNKYEPGRANITIYNWDKVATVNVDLKGVLTPGTKYELRNAQNFFGPPVLTGTYNGELLHVPMNNLPPATPVGLPAPAPTGPEFQVFVLLPEPPSTNEKAAAASFSFDPRSPTVGDEVTFTDQTAGAVVSRSWDFGDPASGTDNFSSLQNPTHVFSGPGTYSVRLIAENEGGQSVRTRDVTVAASPGTRTAVLPVAGHVVGATGATFVTDVSVENPTSASLEANVVFAPSGSGPPVSGTFSLAPGQVRTFPDIVSNQFGLVDVIGSLEVSSAGAPPASLRVAGRTYVQEGSGTLGLGAAGLTDVLTGTQYLSNLTLSDDFRTNVGMFSVAEVAQTLWLELLSDNGSILGRTALTLDPGEQRQWPLSQLFPGASGSGLTVRLLPAGPVAPFAYAAVVDNASSDPTHYSAQKPAPVQFLPGIAAISGYGGAYFRSEISIANVDQGPATVTLTFLEHDRDNTTAPTRTLVLAPGEVFHADDALTTIFGLNETFGGLQVQSDVSPGVVVFERILTDSATAAGTVGQQMDPVSAEDLASAGALLGIRQDASFRSNVGLLNPNPTQAAVSLTLVRSPADILGTAVVPVPPRGYVQRNLAALFPSISPPPGEILSMRIDSGALPVAAFVSVIDNVSQDPTFFPEQP